MRPHRALMAVLGILAMGCQNEEASKPPVLTNPGGNVSNLSPEEAARANEYQQAGNRANAAMEEAARKMREAKGGRG